MKQTFVIDIDLDDRYYILRDYVGKPDCSCNLEKLLRLDYHPEVGDTVYFISNHYWYKGIIARGFIFELLEEKGVNGVDIRLTVMINPKEQPILTFDQIELALPNINWKEGWNNILLSSSDAKILSDLWESFLEKNEIYRGEQSTYKASKIYDAADEIFEEYGDASLEVDMLFNYHDLLKCCDDELLDKFDISYNTKVEFFDEDEVEAGEPNYMYEDPTVIWTPQKKNKLGCLRISCRGYEFENGGE